MTEDQNDIYALDIIHARTTGLRDDVWTEGEFKVLVQFFQKKTGVELTYEAVKQLVESMTREAEQILLHHFEGKV